MKIISSSSADVSRASHCHQTPHALRPHSGPVTSPIESEEHGQLRCRDTATRSAARRAVNR